MKNIQLQNLFDSCLQVDFCKETDINEKKKFAKMVFRQAVYFSNLISSQIESRDLIDINKMQATEDRDEYPRKDKFGQTCPKTVFEKLVK